MDNLKLSLNNTLKFGDNDIFPQHHEYELLKNKEELLNELIVKTNGNYEKGRYCSLPIKAKKNNGDNRIAILIDPILHLEYLTMAIEIAERTENNRILKSENIVHSYRFEPDTISGKLFDTNYGFHSFRKIINTKVQLFNGWAISVDILDFYPSITPAILEFVLKKNVISQELIDKLKNILVAINSEQATGLPIGGNASRILAELILNEVDHFLINEKIDFVRFVDDFVIFAPKGSEIKIIDLINDCFREFGFDINYRKLKISESHLLREESDFFKNIPLYNDEVEIIDDDQIEKIIKGQIEKIKKDKYLNCGNLKFLTSEISINRMAWLIADVLGFLHKGFGVYIQWVLKNIDQINDDVFYKVFATVLNLLTKKHSVIGDEINIAFAVQILGVIKTEQSENLLDELYQKHINSPIIRLSIIQVFAQWKNTDWLKEKIKVQSSTNLWEQRAVLIGLKKDYSIVDKNKLAPWDIYLWS